MTTRVLWWRLETSLSPTKRRNITLWAMYRDAEQEHALATMDLSDFLGLGRFVRQIAWYYIWHYIFYTLNRAYCILTGGDVPVPVMREPRLVRWARRVRELIEGLRKQ